MDESQGKLDIDLSGVHLGMATKLVRDFPQFKEITRIIPRGIFLLESQGFDSNVFFSVHDRKNDKRIFNEPDVAFADPNFFEFFSFPLAAGTASEVLTEPGSMVLSERLAKKYFGNEDPLNQIIYINDSIPFHVTGVFKNLPRNTHLRLDMIMSLAGIKAAASESWTESFYWGYAYVRLSEGEDFVQLESRINEQFDRYFNCPPSVACIGKVTSILQPLNETLFSRMTQDFFITRSHSLLVALRALAFVVLALAWINYITLSISLLNKRLAELGTRKVVGASRRDFMLQFLVEATFVNAISIVVAFTLVQLFRTPLQTLLGFYVVDLPDLPSFTVLIVTAMILIGIIVTGLYPTLISFRTKPVKLLQKFHAHALPLWSRALIVSQYAAAMVIMGWTMSVYFQMNYILKKDMGVARGGVVVVDAPFVNEGDIHSKLDHFVQELLKQRGVRDATVSTSVVGDDSGFGYGLPVNRTSQTLEVGLPTNGGVDDNFIKFYGIKLIAGRNFEGSAAPDAHSVLISKTASQRLGFKDPIDAVGERIFIARNFDREMAVIGVYDDYQFVHSLRSLNMKWGGKTGSILLHRLHGIPEAKPNRISLRVDMNNISESMAVVQHQFTSNFPQEVFKWRLLDDNINRHYDGEKLSRNQLMMLTAISVGIACLGLLGMVSIRAAERTREIGIRKVLGARIHHIISLLTRTLLLQVAVSTMLGIPVSFWLVRIYLERFDDKFSFSWWHYLLPIVAFLLIIALTVTSVVMRATRTNPAESLRTE